MAKYQVGDIIWLKKFYYDNLYERQWFIIFDIALLENLDENLYLVLVNDGEVHFISDEMIDRRIKYRKK